MTRESVGITDTSVGGESPYAGYSREGATIPTMFVLREETENPAIIQAGQTITVNPRRGSQDKDPWRALILLPLPARPLSPSTCFNVHLGETVVPYVTSIPLKALLPLKQGDTQLPANANGVGGIRLGKLERRMRERWQTPLADWEEHKQPVPTNWTCWGDWTIHETVGTIGMAKRNLDTRPIRVAYTKSGEPTAALLFTMIRP